MTTNPFEFHPLADMFPLVVGAEFDALVADVAANGLREKITLYQGKILDGRNRYRASREAGIEVKTELFEGDEASARAFVISKNIHRRHLTAEQRRDLIAGLLKAQPGKSNRQIAKQVSVDHKTVGATRSKLEGRGEIPHVEIRSDTTGRKQAVRQKSPCAKKARWQKPLGKLDRHAVLGWFNSAPIEEQQRLFDALGPRAIAAATPPSWRKDDIRVELRRIVTMTRLNARIEELKRAVTQRDITIAGLQRQLGMPVDDWPDIPSRLLRLPPPAAIQEP